MLAKMYMLITFPEGTIRSAQEPQYQKGSHRTANEKEKRPRWAATVGEEEVGAPGAQRVGDRIVMHETIPTLPMKPMR